MCTLTLCSSHGCRANTAAAHLVADKSLCYMAGRLQEIDTVPGQDSMNTTECLEKERDILVFLILCVSTVLMRWHCHWLTVVVLRSWHTGLASGSVERGAARGGAAQNHGSHRQSGHILGGSGAHHSGTQCGLAQRHAWKMTLGDSTLTSSRWLTEDYSNWTLFSR